MENNFCEFKEKAEDNAVQVPYRNFIGDLPYVEARIRRYISTAVSILSRSMEKPDKEHLSAAKKDLRYFMGTSLQVYNVRSKHTVMKNRQYVVKI